LINCCHVAAAATETNNTGGFIDEDAFFFLLQFLGIEVSEEKQEKLFKQYDTDGSGTIDYEEFKKIWVRHANVRKVCVDLRALYLYTSNAALLSM
jgi:EF hand